MLTDEQERRKTEIQRELIRLRQRQQRDHAAGLLNRVFSAGPGIEQLEHELLAIDPTAVTYRSWSPLREDRVTESAWQQQEGRRRTDFGDLV